jgi:uncharacterized phage-associated protein
MSQIYTASDVANWILCQTDVEAGDSITHLKLQKLIYYCQAWSLALLGRPLFEEDFEAWSHGPVVKSVYDQFKENRWNALPIPEICPEFDGETEELLTSIYKIYADKSAKSLENLTHAEDPWKNARQGYDMEEWCRNIISKDSMAKYYLKRYEDA